MSGDDKSWRTAVERRLSEFEKKQESMMSAIAEIRTSDAVQNSTIDRIREDSKETLSIVRSIKTQIDEKNGGAKWGKWILAVVGGIAAAIAGWKQILGAN